MGELAASGGGFSSVRFSADGKLMLATVPNRVYVLDAFEGKTLYALRTGEGPPGAEGGGGPGAAAHGADFSPDGRYVVAGAPFLCVAKANRRILCGVRLRPVWASPCACARCVWRVVPWWRGGWWW